ncbi:hypothetical protein ACFE04_008927 [Oxalis oulophora]
MDMSNIDMIQHFTMQNPNMIDGFAVPSDYSVESFLPEFSNIYSHNNNLLTTFQANSLNSVPANKFDSAENIDNGNKKRNVIGRSSISFENVSPTASTATSNSNKIVGKETKKRRCRRKDEEKEEEVVHVRTKRGQASDNHSLAERLRREKINQKLRCLQDLVPGCNRTMGMVVMLEEIINYVHSLQNQVEFLSMELGAASSSNGQRFEAESTIKAQGTNAHEAQEMENWGRNQQHGCFQSTSWLY